MSLDTASTPAVWASFVACAEVSVEDVSALDAPARVVGSTRLDRLDPTVPARAEVEVPDVDPGADLVVLAPEEEFTVDPARLAHRHPTTPYAGARLHGVVRSTLLRGVPVDGATPRGRLLRPGAAA